MHCKRVAACFQAATDQLWRHQKNVSSIYLRKDSRRILLQPNDLFITNKSQSIHHSANSMLPFVTGASLAKVRPTILTTNCRNGSTTSDHSDPAPKKPNLRQAARGGQQVKVIAACCFLALLYMYPMIFKPLLGADTQAGDNEKKLQSLGVDLDKFRPSGMPKWTSPFGPKSD